MAGFTSASVLISTVNENESLKRTVNTITGTCCAQDLAEIFLLVGARATEECLAAVEEILENSAIHAVVYRQTQPGLGADFSKIFDLMKGSHVVMLSGDGELDPSQVCEFIEEAKKTPEDIIVGSRKLGAHGFQGYAPCKRVLNSAAHLFLKILFRTKRTELTQPFQIGAVSIFRAVKWEEILHPICIELNLKPLRLGLRTREIPTDWKHRVEGSPNHGKLYFFRYLKTALHIRFMKKQDIIKPGCTIEQKYFCGGKGDL